MRKYFFFVFIQIVLISCSGLNKTTENNSVPKLKLINTIEVPFEQTFQNIKVGGLSGIDYDAKNNRYYLISDDRSLPKFYTANITLTEDKLKIIDFTGVTTLKNSTGGNYSNFNKEPTGSADPEDIRFNPKTNSIIYSSEGARILSEKQTFLENPFVNFSDLNGDYQNHLHLPENLVMKKEEKGPRNNGVLEGISFDTKYKTIYAALEEPLFEDGTQSNINKNGIIRLYQFNAKTKRNTAQYAYQLETVAHEPNPKDAFSVNGISAIQYYKGKQLFIVERSYSTGILPCTIRVFLCDFEKASDIKNIDSVKNQKITLATKKLILNMDDLGIYIDNVEGITFGPKLSNGNQSLIFISDNNFSEKEKTQLFLFELLE